MAAGVVEAGEATAEAGEALPDTEVPVLEDKSCDGTLRQHNTVPTHEDDVRLPIDMVLSATSKVRRRTMRSEGETIDKSTST